MADEPYTCDELFNAIHNETDPTRKAALQADYNAHCRPGGDQHPTSGGNSKPPPPPGK